MSEDKSLEEGIEAAGEFYTSLCKYMGLSEEKSTENVIRAAFGAVEFACVVALQAQVTEKDFKNTVNAIWQGISARHGYDNDINKESDEEKSDENSESGGQDNPSV